MDLTFLPRTILKSRAFVRQAKKMVEHRPRQVSPDVIRDGFFYIGNNPTSIDKLVNVFKRGYAARMIDNARTELQHVLAQDKHTIPSLIFCEGQFDEAAISQFSAFLSDHPVLSSVPFVVNADDFTESALMALAPVKPENEPRVS